MENRQKKENLIELIKKFKNKCPECGKLFLGALIEGSTEVGAYPVYVGISSYPLFCGKCPECAKKCYDNLYKYIEENNKAPCVDYMVDDVTGDDIEEYIDDIKYELDCCIYLDENYQMDQLAWGNPNVHGGELIDLLGFFEDEIIRSIAENEYKRKQMLIEKLEGDHKIQNYEKLFEFLKDEDPRIRIKIIEVLGNKDDPQILEKLIEFLIDKDPSVRKKTIEVLGNKDDPQILEKLIEFLKDKDPSIREKAIEVLGNKDDSLILQNSIILLKDESNYVRNKVIEILKNTKNSQVIQKLFELLKSEDKKISKNIEVILERNNSSEVIDKLIEMLKSENYEVWGQALEILSKKRAIKYLIDNLNNVINLIYDKFNIEESAQVKNFINILKIDKSTSLKYLVEKYKNETSDNQLIILDCIEKIGNERDIKEIIEELQIYDELITILKNKEYEKKKRTLAIKVLKNYISERDVLKFFIEILMDKQENDDVIKEIEEALRKFICFNVENLRYILNYLIDGYHTFDNRLKRKMCQLLLYYEKEYLRNKNFEQEKEILEILIDIINEIERKIVPQEESSEILLKNQENVNEIYKKIVEEIIEDFPFNYLLRILAEIRRKIGREKYIKMVLTKFNYKIQNKFKHEFFSKSFYRYVENFGNLEINSDIRAVIDEIRRDLII